jgi:hypothetical protein
MRKLIQNAAVHKGNESTKKENVTIEIELETKELKTHCRVKREFNVITSSRTLEDDSNLWKRLRKEILHEALRKEIFDVRVEVNAADDRNLVDVVNDLIAHLSPPPPVRVCSEQARPAFKDRSLQSQSIGRRYFLGARASTNSQGPPEQAQAS